MEGNISPEGVREELGLLEADETMLTLGFMLTLSLILVYAVPLHFRQIEGNSAWLSGLLKETEMLSEGLLPSGISDNNP